MDSDAIKQAQERITKAQAELRAAGEEMLKAIGATEQEVSDAADSLADIHHEADADGWAGAEWPQMLASEVLDAREFEQEQADDDQASGVRS